MKTYKVVPITQLNSMVLAERCAIAESFLNDLAYTGYELVRLIEHEGALIGVFAKDLPI